MMEDDDEDEDDDDEEDVVLSLLLILSWCMRRVKSPSLEVLPCNPFGGPCEA